MAITNVNATIRTDGHVARCVQRSTRAITSHSTLTQRQQNLTFRTEFDDHVALTGLAWVLLVRPSRIANPHVTRWVDMNAVREEHQPSAEACNHVPCRVDFENRV